ncbi:heme-binding protein [Paraburkholderia sp. CNPSo 3274]|uniref:GlcG/HbpS family heme-binding protein n=1 Tax=Paraburkholderia sp. CNPSo 3274 TaxID=2940932 RepID=UPI0020B755BD|nr:heme-binding protein [Paraburkholderia sp. CNPSo 3274]MCP3711385.1 heme-binding protein [Paraburkholderia sp. CNPSo 3274]
MRGDHAPVATGESSFRKAFTVVTLGPEFGFDRSSGFFELVKTNPFAPQLATVHNVMALPGAVAFKANGEIVGALGIGGAPGGDKDEVCAAAGVAKVADQLPH